MNLLGTVLWSEIIESADKTILLDVSNLQKGMYIVVFEGETAKDSQYLFVN